MHNHSKQKVVEKRLKICDKVLKINNLISRNLMQTPIIIIITIQVVPLHHQQRINNTMEENKKVVETIKILATTISKAAKISQLHHSNTWVSIHSKRCS